MSVFVAVDDELIAQRIAKAAFRVILVAPAVSRVIAEGLGRCFERAGKVSFTIILDSGEDAYRIGYGDREGLELLQDLASVYHIGLRCQRGLRIGLLVVDNDVLVWSPTPKSVESDRQQNEPNGIELDAPSISKDSVVIRSERAVTSLVDQIKNAIGSDDSDVLASDAQIGQQALTPQVVKETIQTLIDNPAAPFDLSRKTRVFATKYHFVETELRGAAWTKREIKLSSLLLNPDVAIEVQDLFETRIKPFSSLGDIPISVPAIVNGEVAYNRQGQPIMVHDDAG